MTEPSKPEDALRKAGFAAWHRPRPTCPQCGWDTRPTDDGEVCDICRISVVREVKP